MVKRKSYKTSSATQSISTKEGLMAAGEIIKETRKQKIAYDLCGGIVISGTYVIRP